MQNRWRGFTLFELIITTLLIAVLAGAAVPSFQALIARQRQLAEVNALFHAIHEARKLSIVQRRAVSLCPSVDQLTCDGLGDWSNGWILFENTDRDSPPAVDAGEMLLKQHIVDEHVRITANRRGFTLRATFLRATNGTFVICDPNGHISPKALVVSYTGRPRVADHTSKSEAYSCAD